MNIEELSRKHVDLEDLVDYVEWDQSAQLVFWIPAAAQIWHFC